MNRRKTSGGQAIVLVTLALMAMCGMMGLAVDMGWSFFVHKEAQTAADAAALAAVEEGIKRLSGTAPSAFTCSAGGTGGGQLDCQTSTINCSAVVSTSNLNNGCQYAKRNGFDWTTSRQNVTIQSNDGQTANLPPTSPGVKNLTYWVTVRTVQTIPQLFSAVMSKTDSTVSAVATAAIAASIGPGDFYGMNRAGDCSNSSKGQYCGVDVVTGTGNGKTACPDPFGGTSGSVCAPMGMILSSSCHQQKSGFCDEGFASEGGGSGIAAGSITVMNGGILQSGGDFHDMSGNPLSAISSSSSSIFNDYYAGIPQPPIAVDSSGTPLLHPIGTCGYLGGNIPSNVATLGPFQYYSYKVVGGVNVPDGKPITVPNGVTFSASQTTCAGAGAVDGSGAANTSSQSGNPFPSYIFWGGLATGNNANFNAGTYVMAGTTDNSSNGTVMNLGGNLTATSSGNSTGTLFIFTDGQYPGLVAEKVAIPSGNQLDSSGNNTTLYQGTITFKNSTVNLTGMVGSKNSGSTLPAALDAYSGVAWWQDRRNSYGVGYNEASSSGGCSITPGNCTGDDGSVDYCVDNGDCKFASTAKLNAMKTANHVTDDSAGVTLDHGNANLNIKGAWYQPRGAWLFDNDGTATIGGPLQIITGALIEANGDTRVLLAGPTNPIITFKPTLIH